MKGDTVSGSKNCNSKHSEDDDFDREGANSDGGQDDCNCCRCLSGTLTVEQIYQDRDKFAQLVREVAAPDVGRMGIEILSFTIKVREEEDEEGRLHILNTDFAAANRKLRLFALSWQDVYDRVEYLSSLGKTQTAAVKRDADIGVAEAERDAGIRVRENHSLGFVINGARP